MGTSKVFTTAGFRALSTDRALIRKEKLFRPRRNQGRIREVGLVNVYKAMGGGWVDQAEL
jgi:hypothetical protein